MGARSVFRYEARRATKGWAHKRVHFENVFFPHFEPKQKFEAVSRLGAR
jgi:hypothetical protein